MKEKHVTIDESSPPTPTGEIISGQNTPSNGSKSRRLRLPKHLLKPGEDGYRTPTIEDYELQNGTLHNGQSGGALSNNSSHLRLPHTPPSYLGRHNPSSSSLAHSFLDHLQWRERIRHFTWTFFAMTMATGGIANVLYTGTFYGTTNAKFKD